MVQTAQAAGAASRGQALVLADAHVHIYRCFDLSFVLRSAWENFRVRASGGPFRGYLLLTETSGDERFRELSEAAERIGAGYRWKVGPTREVESLRLEDPHGRLLFVVAGRQIATREGLEVLALGTAQSFADGLPLAGAIDAVRSTEALPVIPWGFGKWLGSRGAVLTRYLEGSRPDVLFLGDNSGRPGFWPEPFHFKLAQREGIRVLPGSDPLPFRSEAWRPGSYGFGLETSVDGNRPWSCLRTALLDETSDPRPYGAPEKAHRFVRNQLRMQLRKRQRH